MSALRYTVLLFVCVAMLTGCTDSKVADAQASVGLLLADPATAQFSDVSTNGETVCGLVNAKNHMGAYTGFSGFIVSNGVARLGDESSEFFNEFLQKCGEPAKSKFMALDAARATQRVDAITKALK